ncbi:MAG: 16S rRNA (guanine(966)-N(2))-methyltransferase RsmD [bacterium]
MRIIGGAKKGRILKSPADEKTRPTLSRVREALFDMLRPRIEGTRFLDLFAGTGAIGLEALSHGCAYCCFVEKRSRSCLALEANIKTLGFSANSSVVNKDVASWFHEISSADAPPQPFDVIFLDPPYDTDLVEKTLAHPVLIERLASSGALIIAQIGRKEALDLEPLPLSLIREKSYGDTRLLFFEKL